MAEGRHPDPGVIACRCVNLPVGHSATRGSPLRITAPKPPRRAGQICTPIDTCDVHDGADDRDHRAPVRGRHAVESSLGRSTRSKAETPPASWKCWIKCSPENFRSISVGSSRPIASSPSGSLPNPGRPARAVRWMSPLDEPPPTCLTTGTLRRLRGTSTLGEGRPGAPMSAARHGPEALAKHSGADAAAAPGRYGPIASNIHAMVLAMPLTRQAPAAGLEQVAQIVYRRQVQSPAATLRPQLPACTSRVNVFNHEHRLR